MEEGRQGAANICLCRSGHLMLRGFPSYPLPGATLAIVCSSGVSPLCSALVGWTCRVCVRGAQLCGACPVLPWVRTQKLGKPASLSFAIIALPPPPPISERRFLRLVVLAHVSSPPCPPSSSCQHPTKKTEATLRMKTPQRGGFKSRSLLSTVTRKAERPNGGEGSNPEMGMTAGRLVGHRGRAMVYDKSLGRRDPGRNLVPQRADLLGAAAVRMPGPCQKQSPRQRGRNGLAPPTCAFQGFAGASCWEPLTWGPGTGNLQQSAPHH